MKMHALKLAGLTLFLAACASPTPNLDRGFGNAVRTARALQTAHPEAGATEESVAGQDGVAARESIARYHESFRTPPPVTPVINIGAGAGGR